MLQLYLLLHPHLPVLLFRICSCMSDCLLLLGRKYTVHVYVCAETLEGNVCTSVPIPFSMWRTEYNL